MLLTDNEISDIYEQPSKTPREFARSIEQAVIAKLREQKPVALLFAVLDEELQDLHRFHECVSDGEGYDVPKERMRRLAEIGLLRRVTANIYEHTTFGLSVINGDFTHPAPIPKGWQPIATAPMDGTRVLIKGDCIVVAGWQECIPGVMGWAIVNDAWMSGDVAKYWAPLPKPVAAGSE